MLDQFGKCIQRVYLFLKILDLVPNVNDGQRLMLKRFYRHPIFLLHLLSINLQFFAEVLWLVDALKSRQRFLEITMSFPLCAVKLLSNFKTVSTVVYAHCINDLIERLDKLQLVLSPCGAERDVFITELTGKHISQLNNMSTRVVYLIFITIAFFGMSPFVVMLTGYYNSGEIELLLPLSASYPFNVYGVRYFLIYIYQVWTAFQAAFFLFGPDYLFFTFSTFIYVQFIILEYDMEGVIKGDIEDTNNESFKLKIKKLVIRHVELIRCVDLLETTYSKSILFNAFISSVTICISGFSVLVLDDIVRMATFLFIIKFCLLQILFYCYCGDNIMSSSAKVNDAVYNSSWYNLHASGRRSCLIVMIRAQRSCKLTAMGFFDVNLIAFANILSNTWSYFTLLKTMINPDMVKS